MNSYLTNINLSLDNGSQAVAFGVAYRSQRYRGQRYNIVFIDDALRIKDDSFKEFYEGVFPCIYDAYAKMIINEGEPKETYLSNIWNQPGTGRYQRI